MPKKNIKSKKSPGLALKVVLAVAGGILLLLASFAVPRKGGVINTDIKGVKSGPDSYFHHIYDPDKLLGPLGSTDLELDTFQRTTGNAILFAAFPSLPSADPYFTMQIAEQWAPGKKMNDRGLVIFLFMKEKRIRVEVGYGYEDELTDIATSHIIGETMVPLLREGKVTEAVEAAARTLQEKITKKGRTAGSLWSAIKSEIPAYLGEMKRKTVQLFRIWLSGELKLRLIVSAAALVLWSLLASLLVDTINGLSRLIKFLSRDRSQKDLSGGMAALSGFAAPLIVAAEGFLILFFLSTMGEMFHSGTGMFGGGGVNLFW